MKKISWNKVTWYSKLLALFILFAVFCFGVYCGSELQKIGITNTLAKQEARRAYDMIAAARPIIYEDKELGFKLQLPPAWKDYRLERTYENDFQDVWDEKSQQLIKSENVHLVNFLLKTASNSPEEYGGVFFIYAYSQAEWKQIGGWDKFSDFEKQRFHYLGENDKYAFVYGLGAEYHDYEAFSGRDRDAQVEEKIIPTFEIIK